MTTENGKERVPRSPVGIEYTDINFILRHIEAQLDQPFKEWKNALEEHGRLKVKSTAEQQEAKRKEREKKLKLYNGATSKIFQKKKDGELDEELLTLTGEVLAVNPDFYSLWNFRKETFLALQSSRSLEELQPMFQNELYFLESCLKINPKSYGTWHHRCFVMDTMPKPDWTRELELCNQFLTYDERNFHCWDYRRFIVKRADIKPEAEFEFSMSKISNNFSNYSSWHYRSKLLPLIYPDTSQPMGVMEDALLQEYELVQNGIFTDPDDQSNWFYHRWLMGRGEQNQNVSSFYASRKDSCIILSLTKHIQLESKRFHIQVDCNGKSLDGNESVRWYNHLGNQSFSTTWASNNVTFPEDACDLNITLVENGEPYCCASLQLGKEEECNIFSTAQHSGSSRFSQELSAVKTETLQQELDSINQLIEMETDNKWAALTVILLMKALDPIKYHDSIMTHLTNLEALDFKRRNYYKDLRSKFIIENTIDNMDKTIKSSNAVALSFKDQGLTTFYHTELLSFVREIDLSSNQLTQVKHFGHLQNVCDICLDNNHVDSCHGLGYLSRLENLSLKNNNISNLDDLKALQECPRLMTLNLEGNPICDNLTLIEGMHEILPDVRVIVNESS